MQSPAGDSLAAGAEGNQGYCRGPFMAGQGNFLLAVEVEKGFAFICYYALQGGKGAGEEGVVGVVETSAHGTCQQHAFHALFLCLEQGQLGICVVLVLGEAVCLYGAAFRPGQRFC